MIILLLGAGVLSLFLWVTVFIPKSIAYSDPTVIDYNNQAAPFCALPFFITLAITVISPFAGALEGRIPIFGNKKFKKTWPNPIQQTYPLFSKEYRENRKQTNRELRNFIAVFLTVLLLLTALIIPFGLYPRQVLTENNEFITYNCFNEIKHHQSIEDAESLTIGVRRTSHSSKQLLSWKYHTEITFHFEEESYTFRPMNFGKLSQTEGLEYALYLKSFFSDGQYKVENASRWEDVCEDLSPEKIVLVKKLLDISN